MWITRNTSGLRRVYTWNNQTSPSGPPPPTTSPSAKTNDGRYRVSTIYGVTNFFSPFFSTTPDGNNNHIRSLLPCSVLAVYTIYSISMCVCTAFLKVVVGKTNVDDEYGGEENPFTPHSLSPLRAFMRMAEGGENPAERPLSIVTHK